MLYFVLLAALVVAAAVYYFFIAQRQKGKTANRGKRVDVDEAISTNSVGLQDISYIVSKLKPDSTYLDVLLAIASAPESIVFGTRTHQRKEKMVADRIEQDGKEAKEQEKKNQSKVDADTGFNLDDNGWADDEEDDEDTDDETKERMKLAKAAEEQKAKDREQLKKATGKAKIPLEDVDDDVLGMIWVEKTLAKKGVWPPSDLSFVEGMTFEYNGKDLSALDHPGLRRNLLHMQGRLYSGNLNGHPELLQAAAKQKIDPSYFRGSQEYRQRCALLLEATLRTAVGLRNYRLATAILDAVCVFKSGCESPDKTEFFNDMMIKQYGTLPRLTIENISVENSQPEAKLATGDVLAISLDLTRLHAEAFTRQKVAMFQKQGIPPQVGLSQYREGWWYFLRAERMDGETDASTLQIKKDGILARVNDEDVARFEETAFEDRLLTAWPMIVQNVAQKSGKVKINFKSPIVPGKYKFIVNVKSQDFIGADQDFSVDADIIDISTLKREPTVPTPPKRDNDAQPKDADSKKDE